jgi:isopentenyl-diphosphate delta-isomerase
MDKVVLVDKKDRKIGLMDKLEAHKNGGRLHRAISVLLYRKTGKGTEVLIQKRSRGKPLWPLYWSNTVCTHPRNKEDYKDCAARRLKEELGISLKREELKEVFQFFYQVDYNSELSEHELDTVIVGEYSGTISLNPNEVAEAKWISWNKLTDDLRKNRDVYTPWFQMIAANKKIENIFED